MASHQLILKSHTAPVGVSSNKDYLLQFDDQTITFY